MSNVDINVGRWTDGRKIRRLYRTLLQAGAIKIKSKANAIFVIQSTNRIMRTYFRENS